jgi:hypothetical protein
METRRRRVSMRACTSQAGFDRSDTEVYTASRSTHANSWSEISEKLHAHGKRLSHLCSKSAPGYQRELDRMAASPKHGRACLKMSSACQHVIDEDAGQAPCRKFLDDTKPVEQMLRLSVAAASAGRLDRLRPAKRVQHDETLLELRRQHARLFQRPWRQGASNAAAAVWHRYKDSGRAEPVLSSDIGDHSSEQLERQVAIAVINPVGLSAAGNLSEAVDRLRLHSLDKIMRVVISRSPDNARDLRQIRATRHDPEGHSRPAFSLIDHAENFFGCPQDANARLVQELRGPGEPRILHDTFSHEQPAPKSHALGCLMPCS